MSASRRDLAFFVHLPTGLLGVATGATAPVIPLAALAHGASTTVAALVVAAGGIGTLVADLPAGRLVSQIGERASVGLGTVVGLVGAILCFADISLAVFTTGVAMLGLAQAVWGLARQSYLTSSVPLERRARAISAMAGMHRLGFFAGPFAGAVTLGVWGLPGVFAIQVAAVAVGGALLSRLRDTDPVHATTETRLSVTRTARREGRMLSRFAPAVFALGALRASRAVLLPLWAERVGMDAPTVALLFGVAGAIDVILSYPSGMALDRWGRRSMAVPSTILFASALLGLTLVTAPAGLWIVAIGLGVANGLTNGLVMTIGADVAPADARPQFLSLWRLTHDSGTAGAPVIIGGLIALAGLPAAACAIAAVGLTGAATFARTLPAGPPRRIVEEPAGILEPCAPSSSESPEPVSPSVSKTLGATTLGATTLRATP